MSKIFFFDVDNTISYKGVISESTINTINYLQSLGYYVIIATGRPSLLLGSIKKVINPDGFITLNGASAYFKDKCIYEKSFDKAFLSNIIEDCKKNNDCYTMLNDTNYLCSDVNDKMLQDFLTSLSFPSPKNCTSDFHLNNTIQALGLHPKDASYYINKYTNVDFLKINDFGYDVISKEYTKGYGCKMISEYLNISDTYAFGDNLNDLSMFSEVETSIAMGNAVAELKNIATYITTNVEDNAIEYAIKNILKIGENI